MYGVDMARVKINSDKAIITQIRKEVQSIEVVGHTHVTASLGIKSDRYG